MAGHSERRGSWKADPSLSTRPPFEPGNEMALVHGARSERHLTPLAERFEADLRESAPWTARPAFAAARRAWAYAQAAAELHRRHFDKVGMYDGRGKPRPGLQNWDRAEVTAKNLRRRLGLDPAELTSLVVKLAAVEGPASGQVKSELDALKAEIAEVDAEIAAVNRRKEIGSGD
jgi:hypothetical protein